MGSISTSHQARPSNPASTLSWPKTWPGCNPSIRESTLSAATLAASRIRTIESCCSMRAATPPTKCITLKTAAGPHLPTPVVPALNCATRRPTTPSARHGPPATSPATRNGRRSPTAVWPRRARALRPSTMSSFSGCSTRARCWWMTSAWCRTPVVRTSSSFKTAISSPATPTGGASLATTTARSSPIRTMPTIRCCAWSRPARPSTCTITRRRRSKTATPS